MSDYQYFKTSQVVPTKGTSYSYYECDEDYEVQRYVTHIPETGDLDQIDVDWTMELRREGLEEIDSEQFEEYWTLDPSDA